METIRRTLTARFLRDERGISSVEFAMVAAVFFLIIFGITDFGRALWTWNMAAKATQAGVRYAVVSDYAAMNLRTLNGTDFGPIGLPVPIGAVTPNPTICTIVGCGASVGVTGNIDPIAFQNIVGEMQKFYSDITDADVIVEYFHVGLGFAGNPAGPDVDPVVTVRLRNMDFTFLTPGFSGLTDALSLPPFTASLTGEDGRGS